MREEVIVIGYWSDLKIIKKPGKSNGLQRWSIAAWFPGQLAWTIHLAGLWREMVGEDTDHGGW